MFDVVLPLLASCVSRLARGLATFATLSPTAWQLSEAVCLCHVVAMTTLHATAAEALRIDESNVFPQLIACCASVQRAYLVSF